MYEYKCKLVKVVDGDTVDVDIDLGFGVWLQNQRIRMYGIDAPESRTSDKVEKVYGMAAKDFVIKWTNAGDLVLKTFKDGKGKYGRILGELWYNDVNINQRMIEKDMLLVFVGALADLLKRDMLLVFVGALADLLKRDTLLFVDALADVFDRRPLPRPTVE